MCQFLNERHRFLKRSEGYGAKFAAEIIKPAEIIIPGTSSMW